MLDHARYEIRDRVQPGQRTILHSSTESEAVTKSAS